jgi:hypothetical protein
MKKVLFLMLLVSSFLIQGCVGQWISMNKSPIRTDPRIYDKNYRKGEIKTAFIGQEIIQVKQYLAEQGLYYEISPDFLIITNYKFREIYIDSKSTDKMLTDTVRFDSKSMKANTGEPFNLIRLSDRNNDLWGILVSDDGRIFDKGIYSYYWDMLYIPEVIQMAPVNMTFSIKRSNKMGRVIPDKLYELIYTGRNDVSLNATYREYTHDDLARPAFFHSLTYQPNAKQIRFRDFLIQIHDVTNEKITYTILEDGLK